VTQRTLCGPVEDIELRRLRWRCRRGMKELDVLLERFVERGLTAVGQAEPGALAELLALGDPELASYLLGGQTPAAAHLARLVEHIRGLCRSPRPDAGILISGTD
jgi:antitoxin CptB